MAVPKYHEMLKPLLCALQDGEVHTIEEYRHFIRCWFRLTDDDLNLTLPSGKGNLFRDRVGWAATYLRGAGLVVSPRRKTVQLTQAGVRLVANLPEVVDLDFLRTYPAFVEFEHRSKKKTEKIPLKPEAELNAEFDLYDGEDVSAVSADELSFPRAEGDLREEESTDMNIVSELDSLCRKSGEDLAASLKASLAELGALAFDRMLVKVFSALGYEPRRKSADEDADFCIPVDVLGVRSTIFLKTVYCNRDRKVAKEEVQSFVGAIAGCDGKGLMVTNTGFTEEAVDYAAKKSITLMDADALVQLMIRHDLAVSRHTYTVKTVDASFFEDRTER